MADPELESYIREKQEQQRRMEQPARKISDPERDRPRADPRLAAERRRRRAPSDTERQDVTHHTNQAQTDKGYSS